MLKPITTILFAAILTACGPSPEGLDATIQAALAGTQTHIPTVTPVPSETPTPTRTPRPTRTPTETPVPTTTAVNPGLAEEGFDIADVRIEYLGEFAVELFFNYRLDESANPEDTSIWILPPDECLDPLGGYPTVDLEDQVGQVSLWIYLRNQSECRASEFTIAINWGPFTKKYKDFAHQELVQLPFHLVRSYGSTDDLAYSVSNFNYEAVDRETGVLSFDYTLDDRFPPEAFSFVFFAEESPKCQSNGGGDPITAHQGRYQIEIVVFDSPCHVENFEFAVINDASIFVANQEIEFSFSHGVAGPGATAGIAAPGAFQSEPYGDPPPNEETTAFWNVVVTVLESDPSTALITLDYQIDPDVSLSDLDIGAWSEDCPGVELYHTSAILASRAGSLGETDAIELGFFSPGECTITTLTINLFRNNTSIYSLMYEINFTLDYSATISQGFQSEPFGDPPPTDQVTAFWNVAVTVLGTDPSTARITLDYQIDPDLSLSNLTISAWSWNCPGEEVGARDATPTSHTGALGEEDTLELRLFSPGECAITTLIINLFRNNTSIYSLEYDIEFTLSR